MSNNGWTLVVNKKKYRHNRKQHINRDVDQCIIDASLKYGKEWVDSQYNIHLKNVKMLENIITNRYISDEYNMMLESLQANYIDVQIDKIYKGIELYYLNRKKIDSIVDYLYNKIIMYM